MVGISISQTRERLPELMDEVYFKSKTFIITRRGIPMAKLTSTNGSKNKASLLLSNKRIKSTKRARIKAVKQVFGIWEGRWTKQNTTEISQLLRQKAWQSHAH